MQSLKQKEEEAYSKLERTVNLYVVGQTQRDEILDLIYKWSELALALESECNK